MAAQSERLIQKQVQRILRDPRFRFWKDFIKKFPKGELYLVGGAVRDFVLRRDTKDLDFIVRNVPVKQLMQFLDRHGRVDLVGKRFGVLKFVPRGWEGEALDIALPRTDYALRSGGYKDFHIQSDPKLPIENDLARRDFTVNAIAVRIVNHELGIKNYGIVDPFGGLKDIQKKVLRTVGEPRARFQEDYSRMLRVLRFSCQLGFTIEKKTWTALKKLMPHMQSRRDNEYIVPRETIGRELIKAFVAEPVRALDIWDKSGALASVIPELLQMKKCPQPRAFHTEGDVWVHTRLALQKLMSPGFRRAFPDMAPVAVSILTILLHDIGKPKTLRTPQKHGVDRIRFDGHDLTGSAMARVIAQRLHLSQFPKDDARYHIDTEMLVWLIRYHMLFSEQTMREMRAITLEKYFLKDQYRGRLFQALAWVDMSAAIPAHGKQDFKPLRIVQRRLRGIEKILRRTHVRPIVNGGEVMKRLQLQPGPFIGRLLDALREEQLQGRVRTKKQAWEFLEKKI
ncbi:MAG: HD domain-containing protein [bacterium]|nr:HD domain-containing protein [bacterium]